MKPLRFFRAAVCLSSLLWAGTSAAQMRDVEYATPRVPIHPVASPRSGIAETYTPAQCAELLHELTTALHLQPYQVLVLRRTLAARLQPAQALPASEHRRAAEAAAAPHQPLRELLTETQLAQLRQWETAQPNDHRLSLVASLQ
jgi:hypothetical protein